MRGYRASGIRKRKKKPERGRLILTCLAVSTAIGIFIGLLYVLAQSGTDNEGLRVFLERYIAGFAENRPAGLEILRESLIKYFWPALIIWILAYVPVGGFIAVGIIFFRGFGYGFATAALIKFYGSNGAVYAALLYLPQALIILASYTYVAYFCFNYIFDNMNSKSGDTGIINYFGRFLIGGAGCAVAGVMDAFLTPLLSGIIFS